MDPSGDGAYWRCLIVRYGKPLTGQERSPGHCLFICNVKQLLMKVRVCVSKGGRVNEDARVLLITNMMLYFLNRKIERVILIIT